MLVPAPSEHVFLFPEFIDLLDGDHLAALMLSRIYYWCVMLDKKGKSRLRVVKNGRFWLAKSHTDWTAELRMTRKQSRRCLELLEARGLIQTDVFKFNNTPVMHLFYTGKITPLALQEHSEWPSGANPSGPQGPINWPSGANLITVNTDSEYDSDYTQLASEIADPPDPVGDSGVGEEQKEPMNANDVLKGFEVNTGLKTNSTGIKAMAMLWKKRLATEFSGFKPLTAKEVGQLGHVHKALDAQALPVMDYCLQNWQVFANEVQVQKGVMPPMTPTTGFFCQYWDVAVKLVSANSKAPACSPTPTNSVGQASKVQSIAQEVSPVGDNKGIEEPEQAVETGQTVKDLAAIYAAKFK